MALTATPPTRTRPSDRKVPVVPNLYARHRADGTTGYQVAGRGVQSKTFESVTDAFAYRDELVRGGVLAPLAVDYREITA